MRVTVEKDNGEEEVFQNVTDLYLAVRYRTEISVLNDTVNVVTETRSHSLGANIRELVKELQQSLVELQDYLRVQRGSPS